MLATKFTKANEALSLSFRFKNYENFIDLIICIYNNIQKSYQDLNMSPKVSSMSLYFFC